jgi:simple sugar transport system ATP-binding protein
VAVIPEDRQHEGLLLDASLTKNFALGNHFAPEFSRSGFMRWSAITETANRALAEFDVRPRDPNSIARQLSGGNQQKLIAARELNRDARLVIAAHPTRGVDVGAIEFIHGQILAARDRGCGILLVSSELDEILALSDRILAIFEGRIVGEFPRGEVTEKELGLHFAGVARS